MEGINKNVDHFENVDYVKEGGTYIGRATNLKLVCEAKSLQELEKRMKVMIQSNIDYYSFILEQENPIRFKEVDLSVFRAK